MIHWIAQYQDGGLPQINPDETRNSYYDIDRDKLIAFSIYYNDKLILSIDFNEDTQNPDIGPKRLIWRMRNKVSSDGTTQKVHLAGWQRRVGDSTIQSICYITESGTIVLAGQWQEDKPLLHAPAFQDFEIA